MRTSQSSTTFGQSKLSFKTLFTTHANSCSLVAETMSLYRQKKIKAVDPLKVFDVSEITQAYRYFGLGNRMGKVAVSLENDESVIPVSAHLVI